jgi:hypothetical protein
MNIQKLYRPFTHHFRTKRMREFQQLFGINDQMMILDVGGSEMNWSLLQDRPIVVFVNLKVPQNRSQTALWLIADGTSLPFEEHAFGIVFSNSVIEHLGTLKNQEDFSRECQRVGHTLYIQTPNKNFPIEPHLVTPFIHWLPKSIQKKLLRNFTLWGWIARPSQDFCNHFLEEVRLLDSREMQSLFPRARIHKERFWGMVKSIIAIQK